MNTKILFENEIDSIRSLIEWEDFQLGRIGREIEKIRLGLVGLDRHCNFDVNQFYNEFLSLEYGFEKRSPFTLKYTIETIKNNWRLNHYE